MQRLMKVLMVIATVAAIISTVIGIISRLAETLLAGLTPIAYLRFADTCLLFAITFALFLLVHAKLEGK
ncbi:MAG: hypothetical protein JSW70_01010 [Syntrophobacterales bacterium]|nr:MAG: hypothetical protein JSW70_01010 [Syntrophobacterales bacterium]